jgi:hypothetical protein
MITRKTAEMDTIGRTPAEAERDDWSWMVAEDPAFYLEGGA